MGFCGKCLLFSLNFLVFGLGLAVVVLSSTVLARGQDYIHVLQEGSFPVPVVVLIAGVIILILGFFGCCGALRESPCMLNTYAGFLLVLLLAELAGGVLLLSNLGKVEELVKNALYKSINDYGSDETKDRAINIVQHESECCGVESYKDWATTTYGNHHNVPDSCCIEDIPKCGYNVLTWSEDLLKDKIFMKGCFVEFKDEIEGVNTGLGVSAIVLAVVQLMCVATACSISRRASRLSKY
ncbi:tetraspanin-3-like [Oratosquilla oratoria]|uniref:tetraspanin-3-like n=1 Tax=Oratosquilla oratoria TaxID=337810 RepID=UPI003F77316B